jgi:hypothetical protein
LLYFQAIVIILAHFTYLCISDNLYVMETTIKIAKGKSTRRINLSEFEKGARQIFIREVSVQIKKAKAIQNTSDVIKCNNPV